MGKYLKHTLLVVIFLIYCPQITDYAKDLEIQLFSEASKPLNQRLKNNFSVFNHSAYIDRQITRFMERSELKGVSIAFVKNEKLVYCQSYGYANIETEEETAPEHLFRIASVSKLVTAVAVMKLVEEGKMSLYDTVFGADGYFNDEQYLNIRDKRLLDIKVINLLNHTSGWTQQYGDPMFCPLTIAKKVGDNAPATVDTYLKFVVSRRLRFSPGTMYSYSNMAYVFLGAIIEKVTGMNYEDFVRYEILFPNGIYDMHLGNNTADKKYPNEVKYYEPEGSIKIYACNGDSTLVSKVNGGNDIKLLGAAGGWIASAPELAKFMTLIDGFDNVPDILSKQSIDQMTGGLDKPLGWKEISGGYWTRTGSYAGTAAVIYRKPDGTEWVFISNTSNWHGPKFSKHIKYIMQKIDSRIKEWPDNDLFLFSNPETISYFPGTYDLPEIEKGGEIPTL